MRGIVFLAEPLARRDRVVRVIARMKYPICPESRRVLDELDHLRTDARALLDAASPGAREEWEKLESRFPSDLEIRRGHIALSKPQLDEMRSKVQRFRDILATGQGGPPIPSTATDATRHGNKLTHSRAPTDA
jgi:hypothetical protein